MRVWFQTDRNVVVVDGVSNLFAPNTLYATSSNDNISIMLFGTDLRVFGPASYQLIQDINGNNFANVNDALTYLNIQFTSTKPRSVQMWETPSPSCTWVINHNFGYYPRVTVKDSSGTQFVPDVEHVDFNTLNINLAYPMSGYAYLI